MPAKPEIIDQLVTLRDWLRFAVSHFNAAGLAYGHGTGNAMDEAAFLILETLHLPIDQLEPWLDARLTMPERMRLASIIDARISTRKPAAYLMKCAYIGAQRFYVDERVIVPRSYIGELLDGGLDAFVLEPGEVARILDLCTGGGSLAILAALAFPEAHVDAVDISAGALQVAARNVADYGLGDRITLRRSDLFAELEGPRGCEVGNRSAREGCDVGNRSAREARYDLILSNPPYVTTAAVDAFPPEYKAEPVLAHLGGKDGLDLVRRILAEAGEHLTSRGQLVVEIGMGRDVLEAERPDLPFLWLDTETSSGEVFALPASALTNPRPPKTAPRTVKSRRKASR